ncbi:MAG TPA: histidine kinase [Bacteroidales bacterium]
MTKKRLVSAEFFLLALVWIVLIASPVFFRDEEISSWLDFLGPLETIVPLFFIFLINRFILVPNLLLKKKNFLYTFSVAGVIAAFTLGIFLITPLLEKNKVTQETSQQWQVPPPPHERIRGDAPPPPRTNKRPIPPFANLLIFSVLFVGFDTGLKVSFQLAKTEQEKAKLEKENVANQLDALRNQVSPHFFMNTLNNIHALIDFDSEQAKSSVIQLSKLMRYLLSETQNGKASIQDEFEFLSSYIDLMKLRCSDKVKITVDFDVLETNIQIPSLLFISVVENAFKYGISYSTPSFISIFAKTKDDFLIFETKNSKAKNVEKNGTGVGLANLRKQLDLLFGKNYTFNISENESEFFVQLQIPLKND